MRAAPATSAIVCLLALGSLAGCGGDSATDATNGSTATTAESRPAPPRADFPSAAGRSLREVMKQADRPAELTVAPAAMVFHAGENRYPFGVFEPGLSPVADAEVAIYVSRVPGTKPGARSKDGNKGPVARAEAEALDAQAVGPFPASIETLATKPAFRAKTTADDPDAATVVYSSQLDFPRDGKWRVAALIREDDELSAALLPNASVGEFTRIPGPGDPAPRIHTPTADDVGGDLAKITTRVPPDTQNRVDYADALGREPIVLLFATPQFCQSRVCGPVVDVAEQAKEEYGDEAAFIHMEIFNDNDPGKEVRPQVRRFQLPTEPWLFTIDRNGIVRAAVEGAFGLELMDEAIEAAVSP